MRRPALIVMLLIAAAFGAATLYLIQQTGGRVPAPAMPPAGASAQMMDAMHRMHEESNRVAMTGDIDRDFAALMIPHHRSAVEMAQVYLKHGKDPELRRLSENVVASQEAEIRQLQGGGDERPAGHSGH